MLNKLKTRGFLASGLSTYDFSTLHTTLPHNLIKEKLTESVKQTFNREGSLFWLVMINNAFLTSEQPKRIKLIAFERRALEINYFLLSYISICRGNVE